MFDGDTFGKQMTDVVKSYVDRATAPLIAENQALAARLAEMEKRVPERGEPGEKGEPGQSVDIETLRSDLSEMVKAAIADLPAPERGEKGEPGEAGQKGEQGERGPEGVGVADLMIDRDHNLVATFADGRVKSLGVVVGKDGDNGRDGENGKDGAPGDTFTLDDFDIEQMDERTLSFKFLRGTVMHSFEIEFPVAIYRGVWTEKEYQRGDMVTWAGSVWHAEKATSTKPDTPDGGWKLAVKRGRDGKDAKP